MRLAEFDKDAAGCLWVQESDQAAVGTAPRVFVDQPYALALSSASFASMSATR